MLSALSTQSIQGVNPKLSVYVPKKVSNGKFYSSSITKDLPSIKHNKKKFDEDRLVLIGEI